MTLLEMMLVESIMSRAWSVYWLQKYMVVYGRSKEEGVQRAVCGACRETTDALQAKTTLHHYVGM